MVYLREHDAAMTRADKAGALGGSRLGLSTPTSRFEER